LIGLSLAFGDVRIGRHAKPFRYLPLIPIGISLLSLSGYVFGSPLLYATVRRTEIAWPTAVGILILAIAVFVSRDTAILRVLQARNAGGMAARRLLLPAIAVPILLHVAYSFARDTSWLDQETGRALLALAMVITLAATVLHTSYRLGVVAEG